MKNLLLSLLALMTLFSPVQSEELAPGLTPETLAAIEPMVDRAMAAYNSNNWKSFYADFANIMAGIATEMSFNTLYRDTYKKKYGNYKSRKLNPAKSSVPAINGVLCYDAVFANGNASLDVNIFQENGVWKLQQIQINPR